MIPRSPDDLRPSQRLISEIVRRDPAKLVILGMGGGKTGGTLDAVVRMLNRFEIQHVLVIAPLFVAKNTWPDEIKAWEHTRAISCAVAVGTADERAAAVARRAEVTTINFESLQWLAKHIRTIENWYWDCVIIDESSRFKSGEGRTKPTKVKTVTKSGDIVVKVRKGGNMTRFGIMTTARRKIDRIVELTGTPAPQGLIDLWGQAYLLDQGRALGRDKSEFERRWFDKDEYTYAVTPRPGAEEEILRRLEHLLVTIPHEKVADEPHFIPMKVRLPEQAMRDYREFEKTLYSEPHDVEAVSSGVLANKLMQFCIAKDTEVLAADGWTKIQNVRPGAMVWDGLEWVSTGGAVAQGLRPVVECFGVSMTNDHKVLTASGWKSAKEILNGDAGCRFERQEVRLPDGCREGWDRQRQSRPMASGVRLRNKSAATEPIVAIESPGEIEVVRLPSRGNCVGWRRRPSDDRQPSVGDLAADAQAMPRPRVEGLFELRRPWNRHAGRLVSLLRSLLGGCEGRILPRPHHRSEKQRQGLQQGKLPLGDPEGSATQQADEPSREHPVGTHHSGGSLRKKRRKVYHGLQTRVAGAQRRGSCRERETYDLLDCGPRNRFVVRGRDGCLIVHNCNGHMYREDRSVVHIHDAKMEALDELIEAAQGENILVAYSFKFDKDAIRKRYPHAVVANEHLDFVTDWNKGKIKLGLAHPASIGHGTNLQFGGYIAAWYGLTFSLELWQQFNMRLPRPGQTKQVLIYPIIAEGTYDERALTVLSEKGATQDRIIRNFALHP